MSNSRDQDTHSKDIKHMVYPFLRMFILILVLLKQTRDLRLLCVRGMLIPLSKKSLFYFIHAMEPV